MIRTSKCRYKTLAGTDHWFLGVPFRQLLATRLASQAADGVFEAALAGYILFSPNRAADAGTIAVGLAVVLLPFSVVGPFVGVVLDRVDRRRTLITCGALRSVIALLAAVVLARNSSGESAALVVLAIALLAASRLVLSGISAALPLVVAGDDLVASGGFSTTAGTAATAVGAGLGAGVRAIAGSSDRGLAVVALAAAAAYAASALVSRSAPPHSWGPSPGLAAGYAPGDFVADLRRAAADVAAGARHLWSRRRARDALIAVNAGRIGYGIVFVSTLLLMRARPGHPSGTVIGLGGVLAGLAVGTVAGALLAPRLARRLGRQSVVTLGLVVGGATAMLAAPVGSRLVLVCVSPLLGLGVQLAKVSSDALIQLDVDDGSRGRAFTIVDMAFSVTYVAAAALAAACVPPNGLAPVALGLGGASWLLSGAVHGLVARTAQQPAHGSDEGADQGGRRGGNARTDRDARRR